MQIIRSNDLLRGVPYNFIQFTSLQEVLAGWLGVEPGSYNQVSDSLHLYKKDADLLGIYHSSDIEPNTDSLRLPKEESERVFTKINHLFNSLRARTLQQEELETIAVERTIPQAFQNLLFVVAAETARRKGWHALAQDLMKNCSNPVLVQVWNRWFARFQP